MTPPITSEMSGACERRSDRRGAFPREHTLRNPKIDCPPRCRVSGTGGSAFRERRGSNPGSEALMHSLRADLQRIGDLRPRPARSSGLANLVFFAYLRHLS
jgi:hypothetical protein